LRKEVLSSPELRIDKGTLGKLLEDLGKLDPKGYGEQISKLMRLGNDYSYSNVASVGLSDFLANTGPRDAVLSDAKEEVRKVRRATRDKGDADQQVIGIYSKVRDTLDRMEKGRLAVEPNRMYDWVRSGARGDWDQFRQMIVAPLLVKDPQNRIVPVPITRSYSEGLDTASYWTAMHGARKGTLQKVSGTREPGAATKDIINTVINMVVADKDCGTHNGALLDIGDADTENRFLAADVKAGNDTVTAGTLLDSSVLTRLKNNGVRKVSVRSPLKCELGEGVCARCYGLNEKGRSHEIGVNVGAISGQALGEPATQLAMKAFHTGGVVGSKGDTDKFTRLGELLRMPQILKGAATIALKSGTVQRVEKDPAGGHGVYIEGERHYVPAGKGLLVHTGQKIKAGQLVSEGSINPHDLLAATNISSVQNYLTGELKGLYQDEGVKRRNIEVVVRALTNLSHIDDPGDTHFIRGDVAPRSVLNKENKELLTQGKQPARHTPILRGVRQIPLEMQEDWLARMQYQKLKSTVLDGVLEGWKSDIHGLHPVPGLAFGAEFGLPPAAQAAKGAY